MLHAILRALALRIFTDSASLQPRAVGTFIDLILIGLGMEDVRTQVCC